MQKGTNLAEKEKKMGTLKNRIIYILPGWTYNTEKWSPLIKLLGETGFTVNKLDIPGLITPIKKPWQIEDYVDWLNAILSEEKRKIILIGHSNGGRIAISYVLKYPEKLAQIILIDSAGIYHNDLKIRIKRVVFKTLAKAGKFLQIPQGSGKLLYKLAREKDYVNSNELLRKTMVHLISLDLKNIPSKISVPTIIIWGEHDKITPRSDAKIMQQMISKSKLFIIDDAKHSPQYTHPEEVFKIIKNNIL